MMLKGGRSPEGNRSKSEWKSRWLGSLPASRPRTSPPSGAAWDNEQDRRALLAAGVRRLRALQGVDRRAQARRLHRRLQRPHVGVLARDRADLRPRLRGRIPDRRRGLGPAQGAAGQRPSRARLAHRPVAHPRRIRHHHRQQDGGRSRPHRAALADVRPARRMAVPGRSRSPSTSCVIRCRPGTAATSWARRSARRSSPSTRTCAS